MSTAHERKKQPEVVRRALIDCAARLAVDRGLHAVTVQAVSDAAGVTKGGLFHHFPNKEKLIEAVFQDKLMSFEVALNERWKRMGRHMAASPVPTSLPHCRWTKPGASSELSASR